MICRERQAAGASRYLGIAPSSLVSGVRRKNPYTELSN